MSDENVGVLMAGMVAGGEACDYLYMFAFNFLIRREKSLNMSLRNPLPSWRMRGCGQPHMPSSSWRLCPKSPEKDGSNGAVINAMSCRLREDASPILMMFCESRIFETRIRCLKVGGYCPGTKEIAPW